MTKPKLAQDKGRDGVRTYGWPPLPPHELQVVSVTSILDNLPKPWLVGWAVKMTAERAISKRDIWQAMVDDDDEKGALKYLKDARWSSSSGKADRGTVVHAALETYLSGKDVDPEAVAAHLEELKVPKALRSATLGMINGLLEFLTDEEPEVFWSESTVFSREYGYAGTPDLIAMMRVGGSRQPVIIDVKTSPRIYDETALQLLAYSRADFVGLDDGAEEPLLPGAPRAGVARDIKHGVVVRPMPSGKYEKAVFTLESEDDLLFDIFLACLTLTRAESALRAARRP